MKSSISNYNQAPTLFIDGVPVPALAYITYFEEYGCFQDFAKAGYKLFSVPVFFGDQTINDNAGITPFSPGIFSQKGKADFSVLERLIRQILDAVPDALIFPRVNVSMPRWWEDENPDECNDTGGKYTGRRGCFSSEKWLTDTTGFLLEFLKYSENADWKDHICGYQLAGGKTEEWFGYDGLGSTGKRAREKFAEFSPDDQSETAFHQYLSFAAADAICRLAAETKKAIGSRVIVGTFYGYNFEVPEWQSNHHALSYLLRSPDIDFICSPSSYVMRNTPGADWPVMLPVESIKLHGKLYMTEFDTRTNLSDFLFKHRPAGCPEGTYNAPVWLGPETERQSIGNLRMNFAFQLEHNTGSWWFDMWGGWFSSEKMMQELARFRELAPDFLHTPNREKTADCAVFIDENAFSLREKRAQCVHRHGRHALCQSGITFDYFEISDFRQVFERYKAVIFFVPAETPALAAAEELCRTGSIPFMELRETEEIPTADDIRNFCTDNNIHCYITSGDAVHVSGCMIALRAASDGEKKLTLPAVRKLTPVLEKEGKTVETDTLTLFMNTGDTMIWKMD